MKFFTSSTFSIATAAILLTTSTLPLTGQTSDPSHENAEIRVSKNTWEADTVIEVSFPRMMVNEEDLNKPMPNGPVVIKPDLPLQLTWTSPRVARIHFESPPRPATTYTLTTSEKAMDLLGTIVIPAEPVKLNTPTLRIISSQTPMPINGATPRQPRQPAFLLLWNAPVNADSVTNAFHMRDDKNTIILCTARQARWEELGDQARRTIPWRRSMILGQRFLENDQIPTHPADRQIPHALIVEPVQPLPPGENWHLVIPEGITSANNNRVRTTEELTQRFGNVNHFAVTTIQPSSGVNMDNSIYIRFNKTIASSAIESGILKWIKVIPEPHGGITAETHGSTIYLKGDFKFNASYRVNISPGLQATDDTLLPNPFNTVNTFTPAPPQIGLPTVNNVQILHGRGKYPISYANLSNIRIRIKAIAPENAGFALNAIDLYENTIHANWNHEQGPQRNPINLPFEFIAGTTLYDKTTTHKTNEINKGRSIELNWQDILPNNNQPAILFLSVEGTPANPLPGVRQAVTRTFLQITDIGAVWKSEQHSKTRDFFIFSHLSGQPINQAEIAYLNSEGKILDKTTTNDKGFAKLPNANTENAYILIKSNDGDSRVIHSNALDNHLSPWQIGASRFTSWDDQPTPVTRRNHIFTERNLYRPGETVYLKGTHRYIENDIPVVPDNIDEVTLNVRDSKSRLIHEETLAFSEYGTFHTSFTLPSENLGHYNILITYPMAYDKEPDWQRTFSHFFQVSDFRRNAFEITLGANENYTAPETFAFPLEANYYLGAPCAHADVSWTLHTQNSGFYPERFREFLFGDHRKDDSGYWYHYYGYSNYYSNLNANNTYVSGTDKTDAAGTLTITPEVPAQGDFPSLRTSTINTEVTDANQQTLFASKSFTIHPASFYLGIQRIDKLVHTDNSIDLAVIAIDTKQIPFEEDITAKLTIEKIVWNSVEIERAGGGTSQRNESEKILVSEEEITLNAGKTKLNLTFDDTAEYHISLSALDDDDNETRTTISIHVHGPNVSAWELRQGINFDILPDKRSYKPGDTAKLLLKTPILGTAYITLEHNSISRTLVRKLSGEQPVLEIPIIDSDAPNIFVSVIVVKGTDNSPMKHPIPMLRIGYTELQVENTAPRITIDVNPLTPSVRPGHEATVALTLVNHTGTPVPNAEIALYAVDMGVLAVSNSPDPDPIAHFYPDRRLLVQTGSGIHHLLTEDPSEQFTWNKGLLIGGGFDDLSSNPSLRHDFRPCAFWQADILSDENGRAEVTFAVPDTLTRYRIIAVANTIDGHFGTGNGELEVNKPIMIEPAVPRFAHAGDHMTLKAQILNQSSTNGTFLVELVLDSLVSPQLISSSEAFTHEITLAQGENGSLEFPVTFNSPGNTTLLWKVTPVRLDNTPSIPDNHELSDAVQSQFEIVHPITILSQIRSHHLPHDLNQIDLATGLEKHLLEGEGEIIVHIANTRMIEVIPAIEHLLTYPYGCLEQTTSSLIPWITYHGWQDVLPTKRDPGEVATTISYGVSRLLTMQNHEGGFGYWSGSDASNLWGTNHAALALLMAKNQGISVPQENIDQFCTFLSRQLRQLENSNLDARSNRPDLAASLYILALAGKAEPAYHEWFLKRLDQLHANEAFYIAMAIQAAGGDETSAQTAYQHGISKLTANDNATRQRWYPNNQTHSLALIASCKLGLDYTTAGKHLDRLLGARNPQGHWATTYTNSWGLMAMDAYRQAFETTTSGAKGTLAFNEQNLNVELPAKPTSIQHTLALTGTPPSDIKFIRKPEHNNNIFFQVELRSRPKEMPRQRSDRGFTITRTYQRVQPDGSLENTDRLHIGDLVAVTLDVTNKQSGYYLVIDDPLPSTFEAINPTFTSQGGSRDAMQQQRTWSSSHTELRDDRALFFCNRLWNPGQFKITYLARVTGVGTVQVPGTLIETMYDPETYGLSEPMILETHPREE